MVPMKNKVTQFPQPSRGKPEVPIDKPQIIFSLGDQRFAVQYTVMQVHRKQAEVIPIQKRRNRKSAERRAKS
jgi:hypothetical protein